MRPTTPTGAPTVSSDVLDDPAFTVPPLPDPTATSGVAGLRAAVVRFCDGPVHTARRRSVEVLLGGLDVRAVTGQHPTAAVLDALGLPGALLADVDLVAAAYQPHLPVPAAADAAADRLVAACGGPSEQAAARVCVLVQAHAATTALVERLRTGSPEPPVPVTRRVGPDGTEVLVDLTDAPYGRGPHACPGRDLAPRLAIAALR